MSPTSLLEMGKNPKFWFEFFNDKSSVLLGFFIDGIRKMFPWRSSVTD